MQGSEAQLGSQNLLDAGGDASYTASRHMCHGMESCNHGVSDVSDTGHHPGFFQDHSGEWKKERRASHDRRKRNMSFDHPDRRRSSRRQADLELAEREHKEMIEEALEEFAAEHDPDHP